MLKTWYRRIWQQKAKLPAENMKARSLGQPGVPNAGSFRPQLEILEDRTLLSPGVGFWQSSSQYVNGILYFTASDWFHGQELWKSDGTGDGTSMVADINLGMAGSWPQNLMDVNGTLFFTAEDAVHGRQLWKTDGTQAGTVMLTNFNPSSSVDSSSEFATVNGELFFSTFDYVGPSGFGQQLYNYELWKSDGTPSGTQLVAQIPQTRVYLGLCQVLTPYGQGDLMTAVNGMLYFFIPGDSSTLWKSDGITAGTTIVARIPLDWYFTSVVTGDLVNLDGTLYFAHAGSDGGELWKSDGTPAGTVMVENFPSYEFVDNLFDANGTLMFTVGSQLWKSDGTAAGMMLLADTNPGLSLAGFSDFTLVHGSLYFLTSAEGAAPQLWKSDGTPAGTSALATIGPMSPSDATGFYESLPGHLTNVNGTLFFTGPDATGGENLWKSDGTSAGTILVQDVDTRLGAAWASQNQLNMGLGQFVNGGGVLFFQAPDNFLNPQAWSRGTELWKSDGTATGTVLIADMNPVSGKIVLQSAPPAHHTVGGGTSGNLTTVFSVNADHQLFRHDAVNGWVLLRDGIQSIGLVTDSGSRQVVFALTTDQALLRYDTVTGWQNLADPGTIRTMSAGTDVSGLADVFVVLADGSLTEWQQASGWLANPLTEPDPVWQGSPVGGPGSVVSLSAVDQGRVIVAFANGSVAVYDSPAGFVSFLELPLDFTQSLAAVTDAKGRLNVFAYSANGGLWQWQEGGAVPTLNQIATDNSIQPLSAGTDADGEANVFALTVSGALMEYQKSSGWTRLNLPGTVQDLSAASMDHLFVVLTDGRVFERDDQHGFLRI